MTETKKLAAGILAALLAAILTGCAATDTGAINIVSREDGSGTRAAFVDLMGIEIKSGTARTDLTGDEAIIVNKTGVMLSIVSADENAIGYVSVGSLGDEVKALKIDGIEPTAENIKSGSYGVARPFNLVVGDETSELAEDFIGFILSAEGQGIVSEGYVPVEDNAAAFKGKLPGGKMVIAGSSSVMPVMEKLKESYEGINPGAVIELQMSDSSSGIAGVIDGTCSIGLASRELKDAEAEKVKAIPIALDGIAIIVNKLNPLDNLSRERARSIFTADIRNFIDGGSANEASN